MMAAEIPRYFGGLWGAKETACTSEHPQQPEKAANTLEVLWQAKKTPCVSELPPVADREVPASEFP